MITSLRSKIRLVFFLSTLLLAALFFFSIKFDQAVFNERSQAQERAISHYLYNYYLKYNQIDEAYLESQNVSLITDKGKVVQIERFFKDKGKVKRYAVDTYRLKRIMIINNDRFKLILENKNKAKFPLKLTVIFSTIFLLMIILYLWIMKSFKPLSKLKSQIQTFSQGNLDINCKSDKKDEIAEVANEFDHAVTMIRELIYSRQLFLRAIMHELKTPIGKGRLVAEMIGDEKNKIRLHSIFERLNLLIDEFAKIEQITSKNFDLNIKPYQISDLIEASIDMLMIDNPQRMISIQVINPYRVNVDFELMTLVIKNLLDNALKYSSNNQVIIRVNNKIDIINEGAELTEPLENYYKPFHTSNQGLGLGIYIVKSILDIHHMKLEYKHKDKHNTFTILN